jgi:hypothetical protein
MTRAYSLAFKQKMIERLTGKDAVSANQRSKDTGVRQQNLSRWPAYRKASSAQIGGLGDD